MTLSCTGLKWFPAPMRLAGTWKQYSKKAISQLTKITFHRASLRKRRCPYQANVMKMLEMMRRTIVHINKLDAEWVGRVAGTCCGLLDLARKWNCDDNISREF